MAASLEKPSHVKYRHESTFGLVYDHENYGHDDASLTTVDERIVDLLEFVGDDVYTRAELESAFAPPVVDAAVEEGFLRVD